VGDPLAGISFTQLRKVEPGAEMLAMPIEHRSAYRGGQLIEARSKRQDQAVVERVALGRTVQGNQGQLLLLAHQLDVQVWVIHEAEA
jgi:hypothetical protein